MQKFREIIENALMELKLDMEQAYGEIKPMVRSKWFSIFIILHGV